MGYASEPGGAYAGDSAGADYAAVTSADAAGPMAEAPSAVAPSDESEALTMADDDGDEGYAPVQAGRLTAGTFDDTLNAAAFASFMRSMADAGTTAGVAGEFAGPMTVVTLVDPTGRPAAGRKVRVVGAQGQSKTLVSGTDGRIVMFAGADGRPSEQGWSVSVLGERRVAPRVAPVGGEVTFKVSGQSRGIEKLDIALVIDATGSMSDELEYLKVELRSIAQSVERSFPGVDQRFALVVYRDQGDRYVTRTFDFTKNLRAFERDLGRQRADGGGDYPEAMHTAMEDAAELSWRSDDRTARLAFLVADAPPHTQAMRDTMRATDSLRAQGVGIYPVAASGVAAEAETIMRASAAASGGQYLFLTDDSGVGNSHAEPHIPCYAVEALRDAMTRMVHTELAGKRVEADPRRAVRFVGNSQGGVCQALRVAG